MKPDPASTRAFLGKMLLDDSSPITFQTFDDKGKDRRLAVILDGTFNQWGPKLTELNNRGAGIFWTVNETDGNGRKAENIVKVRALFVDLDGAPLQPVLDWMLQPEVIVESSPGRYHAYWIVKDFPKQRFAVYQKVLIKKFNADQSCIDLPRVLRLPGFIHQKAQPFLTRIWDDGQEDRTF